MEVVEFILSSRVALILSLVAWCCLVLLVVHIRAFLQPKFYLPNKPSKDKPFLNYWSYFFKDLSKKRLYTNALGYLNPFSKDKFKSIEIRKIDRIVNVLEFFATYLAPLILCSVVFFFIKLDIARYMPSDVNNTLYPKIQGLLVNIKNNETYQFFNNHKKKIDLLLWILILIIPALFFYKNKIKTYQKRFSQFLIILGIITSITLFTKGTEREYRKNETKLTGLKLAIEDIHLEIYEKSLSVAIKEKFGDEINRKFSEYEKIIENFKNNKQADLFSIEGQSIKEELDKKLQSYIDSLDQVTLKLTVPEITNRTYETKEKEFERFRNTSLKNNKNRSPETDYIFDSNKWTYSKGEKLKEEVIKRNDRIKSKYKKAYSSSKARYIFEKAYDVLVSLVANAFTDYVSETPNEIISTTLKGFSKSYKDDIVDLIDSAFKGSLEPNKLSEKEIDSKKSKMSSGYNSIVSKYNKKEKKRILGVKIRSEERQIKDKIKDAVFTEILKEYKNTDYSNVNLEGKPISFSEIEDMEKKRDYFLQNSENFRSEILKRYSNEIESAYSNFINSAPPIKDEQYLQRLINTTGAGIIQVNDFFEKISRVNTGYVPNICIRCGLDMNYVTICPASIVLPIR